MPVAQLNPFDRYAIVGKTGSGKTMLAMVLAGTFARALPAWEVWWIDTKNDPDDIKKLREWGFRNAASDPDRKTSNMRNAIYFILKPQHAGDGKELGVVEQAQEVISMAYEQGQVIIVVDEYVQVVPSVRDAGAALLNVFQRGRGRKVGLIGLTQEPVYVPRQLLSQASHQVLFSVTHGYDIDYLRKMEKAYQVPNKMGDPHGFWWKWVDGNGEVVYYPNQSVWYENLRIATPRQQMQLESQG